MGTSTDHVITIANSIIGVSVLAMPFCFKQCGIVLSILLLLLSGIMTRLACHYLLKSAITTRRRNFEFVAFHAFGPSGKLFVELGIIGFMLGTCIAFFVVMGDLGPAIIGPALNIDSFSTLRPSVLMGLGLLVVLPLGLLKNVDSLSAVCAASIAFYLCLVLKVMAEATTHLISWDWVEKVNLWRPAGIPQCIPIFSMALSCQTQLFEIFDSVPNTSLEKMNAVIKSAINMCTAVYISVGFFGYIAFCTQNFSGNLLMSFSPTVVSEMIKLGFVLSVAVSFPLVIFPCRASLHSLLFRRGHTPHHELLSGGGDYIPEPRFKCLTIFIVMFSLGTGLLIPNIEVVLGLVGSTIGIMICIMFPALIFVCISNKHNNERLVAKILFAIGLIIMILGTYTNLYATEEALTKPSLETQKVIPPANVGDLPPPQIPDVVKENKNILDEKLIGVVPDIVNDIKTPLSVEIKKENPIPEVIPDEVDSNKRKEPPIPVEPRDTAVIKDIKEVNVPLVPSVLTKIKDKKDDQLEDKVIKKPDSPLPNNDIKKDETISNDAIKREEDEIKESKARTSVDVQKKNEELFEKLSKHEEEQKKIIQEQKKLLEELKKQNQQQQLQNNINANQDKYSNGLAINKLQNKVLDENPIIKKETEIKMEQELLVKKHEETVQEHKIEKVLDIKDLNLSNHLSNDNIIEGEKTIVSKVPSKDNLPPIITNEMVKGVPLPLVIKDSAVLKKSVLEENRINESKKVDNTLNNKPQVRDILGENKKLVKEEREKRDLDIVVKMDKIIKEVDKLEVVPDKDANKKEFNSEKVMHHDKESSDNVVKQTDKESLSLVKILDEEKIDAGDNCPKPEKPEGVENVDANEGMNGKPIVADKNIVNGMVAENKKDNKDGIIDHELIKTPSILSNPEVPEIDTANMKSGNPVRNSIQEMKPMSRDLKSVKIAEDTRGQERASEVT